MIFGFATANAQEHIKRETPWHWSGFNTIEDKASVGEVSKKLATILDVGDCTETMLALLRIFKQSSISILDNIIPRIVNKIEE